MEVVEGHGNLGGRVLGCRVGANGMARTPEVFIARSLGFVKGRGGYKYAVCQKERALPAVSFALRNGRVFST